MFAPFCPNFWKVRNKSLVTKYFRAYCYNLWKRWKLKCFSYYLCNPYSLNKLSRSAICVCWLVTLSLIACLPECGRCLITGDIVGAGLTTSAAVDAEVALNKPFGSAEQNLYNFAYTLYNLKYLKATNQLRQEILEANLGFMNLCMSSSIYFY